MEQVCCKGGRLCWKIKKHFLITSHCKLELLKKSHYLLTDPRTCQIKAIKYFKSTLFSTFKGKLLQVQSNSFLFKLKVPNLSPLQAWFSIKIVVSNLGVAGGWFKITHWSQSKEKGHLFDCCTSCASGQTC